MLCRMDARFAVEPLTAALWDEAWPLLVEHWREIAHYPDIPLSPDQATYTASAAAGIVRVFTARTPSGALVGYALFFVRPNPHYAESLQAAQDVIYLHPSMRGFNGIKFLRYCDEQLQAEGVQVVYQHVKVRAGQDFGPILERMGYERIDAIYGRRLDIPKQTGRAMASLLLARNGVA